jgi:cellobiose phosphorylase
MAWTRWAPRPGRKRLARLLPLRRAPALCRLAHAQGERAFAQSCLSEAAVLRGNIELHGWDGEWYRRAYFDDGSPLGSAGNAECRIDSIAQSWSVLSGAGEPPAPVRRWRPWIETWFAGRTRS